MRKLKAGDTGMVTGSQMMRKIEPYALNASRIDRVACRVNRKKETRSVGKAKRDRA